MSNRNSLLRLIILVTFLILVLVIVSTQRIHRVDNFSHPIFKELFYWNENGKAFSLLLHSILLKNHSFTAFSPSRDSIMEFSATQSEIKSLERKLTNISLSPQDCLNCHQGK